MYTYYCVIFSTKLATAKMGLLAVANLGLQRTRTVHVHVRVVYCTANNLPSKVRKYFRTFYSIKLLLHVYVYT